MMNVKKISVVFMVCLMSSSLFAATIYPVANGVNWADDSSWSTGAVPPLTGSNELKLFGSASADTSQDWVVTVNTNVGNYTTSKFITARGSTLLIADGAYIGNGREVNIGDSGTTGNGSDDGFLVQTGGTLDITASGKLQIGYKAHVVDNPITGAKGGQYTISGGTLTGATGRIYIGCSSAAGSIGKMIVDGSAATITMGGNLYISNASATGASNEGTGTLQFNVVNGAVSKIQVAATILDTMDSDTAIATLLVNSTGTAPTSDIVLVENTGTADVVGLFDNAAEGTIFNVGGVNMTLTYKYVAGNDNVANDIALVIPEPATLALLGLGLLAFRRK
jgi:hypothetical protein